MNTQAGAEKRMQRRERKGRATRDAIAMSVHSTSDKNLDAMIAALRVNIPLQQHTLAIALRERRVRRREAKAKR